MTTDPGKAAGALGPGMRSILRNGAYLVGSHWLATGLRAAYVVILARALGPADYGLISSTQALYIMFVAAATVGIPAYLSRERAQNQGRGEEAVQLALIVQGVAVALGGASFLAIGLVFESESLTQLVFVIFAGTVLARGCALFGRQAFVAFEVSRYQLRLVYIFRSGEVLAVVLALMVGGGVIAVAAIHLISWMLEGAVALGLVHRKVAPFRPSWPRWARLRAGIVGMLGIGAALAAGEWLRLAPIALVRYVIDDAPSVGQFALAWNASLILTAMAVASMQAAFPVLSRASARGDGKDLWYLDFCIRYGVLLGAAAAIGGLAFGSWAVMAVFGPQYAGAGEIFAATLVLIGPIVVNHVLDQTLFLRGRTGHILILNAIALAAVVAGFAPVFQTVGPNEAVLTVGGILALLALAKIGMIVVLTGATVVSGLIRALATVAVALVAAVPLTTVSPWAGCAGGLAVLAAAAVASRVVSERERRTLLDAVLRRKSR